MKILKIRLILKEPADYNNPCFHSASEYVPFNVIIQQNSLLLWYINVYVCILDLKRSKSSPILPYVFEARAGAGAGAGGTPNRRSEGGASTNVTRRESGKYSKSQKKH